MLVTPNGNGVYRQVSGHRPVAVRERNTGDSRPYNRMRTSHSFYRELKLESGCRAYPDCFTCPYDDCVKGKVKPRLRGNK